MHNLPVTGGLSLLLQREKLGLGTTKIKMRRNNMQAKKHYDVCVRSQQRGLNRIPTDAGVTG
jgi:hypothetical protein